MELIFRFVHHLCKGKHFKDSLNGLSSLDGMRCKTAGGIAALHQAQPGDSQLRCIFENCHTMLIYQPEEKLETNNTQ